MARIRRGNFKFLDKFSWYVPGWSGLFALLGWLVVGGLAGNLIELLLALFMSKEALLSYGTLISYPVMFIPPMLYAAGKSARLSMNSAGVKLDSSHFSPVGGALCVILAFVGVIALSFWAEAITALLPEMPAFLKEALESMTKGVFWANFLSVCIFAPFFEEWLCRGMILRGLLSRGVKPFWAIVASAAFFAFIHLNPWQAIPAFAAGCLLGYVYYKTGSLKLTMLMHFTNNAFSLCASRVPGWEEAETFRDIIPGGPYWILLAASVIVTVLVVLEFRKVSLKRSEGNMDTVPSLFESDEV